MRSKVVRRIGYVSRRLRKWWRGMWPELVELDAYRALKWIDEKLKTWPRAIPLHEAAMQACRVTGQEDKWFDYARRLRDIEPPVLSELGVNGWIAEHQQDEINSQLFERAVMLVGTLSSISAQELGRRLGISIAKAEVVLKRLADERVVGPAVGVHKVYIHIKKSA